MRPRCSRLLLLALSFALANPAAAQRTPLPIVPALPSHALMTAAPRTAIDRDPSRVPWDSLTPGARDLHRALWATGDGLIGAAAGGAVGLMLARSDGRPADMRELDGLAVIGLAAIGETIGVTLGAASPGGRGRGSCRGDVRLGRSFLGTAAGTVATLFLASRSPAAGYLLVPAGQIAGAVLSLGGC